MLITSYLDIDLVYKNKRKEVQDEINYIIIIYRIEVGALNA